MKKQLPISCLAALLGFVLITIAVAIPIFIAKGPQYRYTDEMTSEYFYTNYFRMEPNYMFSRIHSNAADKGIAYSVDGEDHRFYALRDEPVSKYAVCAQRMWIFDSNKYTVYASNSNETDLVGLYGINKVTVFLRDMYDKKWDNYEKNSTKKLLDTSNNGETCASLQGSISERSAYVRSNGDSALDIRLTNRLYCTDEGYLNANVYLRVYTPATENVFWESALIIYEGEYHLACYLDENRGDYYLIPLSQEVKDYINSVLSESGFAFSSEYIQAD